MSLGFQPEYWRTHTIRYRAIIKLDLLLYKNSTAHSNYNQYF